MSINKYKIVRRIKWGIYYVFRFLIRFENLYLPRKNKKIQRLFSTTGNISLINVLSIINEIGDFDKYDDILIIDSGKGEDAFVKKQLEIAKLHNFKKILASPRITGGVQAVLNNVWNVDEVYLLNHPLHMSTILSLYQRAKIILIDEGPGSLINYNSDKIKNLVGFKTHKYLDKLDFLGLEDINKIKFEPISVSEFKKNANTLSNKFPMNIKPMQNDKTILYCSVYWEVSGLDRETFAREQKVLLENLINAGYSILYKAHPRDNDFYGLENNPNVQFIDCKYPIELYNLDVLAIVSMSSSTSLSPAHYWGVPCFCNILDNTLSYNENMVNLNVIRFIIKEYSPNYKELLNFDVKNTSREELKQKIKQTYDDFLKDKPLLSENQTVKDYAKKYGSN